MMDFAERTGLTSNHPVQRYLWTDAFAVCNFLSLSKATNNISYMELANHLVQQVHHTLGKHRSDDSRTGWISGLADSIAEAHPTQGGLRIGKQLPERKAEQPLDAPLEWERDGQYFHYLTKWMHALDQMARVTQNPLYNRWAQELAKVAYAAFTYQPAGSNHLAMVWKMSIDLSRPLVASMGQHDPLDGWITCLQLQATAAKLLDEPTNHLEQEIANFARMIETRNLVTADPLGLGGLLFDAYRIEQLMKQGIQIENHFLHQLLAATLAGLRYYAAHHEQDRPAVQRLAFRELGLAIGLQAIGLMESASSDLRSYIPLAEAITSFWLDPNQRENQVWTEHGNINDVMLATCLVPEDFLSLRFASEKKPS